MKLSAHNATIEKLRSAQPPSFLERDPFKLKQFYVEEFERLTKRKLYSSQTEMYIIEVLAYASSIFAEGGQLAFLQNRAIWAEKGHLDEIGANVSTFRLPAQHAKTTVRFVLGTALTSDLAIPKGTLVAAGEIEFGTLADATIFAGGLSVDVLAQAKTSGSAANDLLPGQIDSVVSPIPASINVENINVSAGGIAEESDERFRLRVTNAFERISKAGPIEGYKQLVRSVHQSIIDVNVDRPQPGYIVITPLTLDGVASNELDAQILAACDPEKTVPMGDYVSVAKATAINFDVTQTVRVEPGHNQDWSAIATKAITDQFALWAKTLGQHIAPSAINAAVKSIPGVIDVEGPGFNFTDLDKTSFAQLGNINITITETPNV